MHMLIMNHLQESPVSNATLLSKSKQLSHVQAIFIAGSLYTVPLEALSIASFILASKC